MTKTQRSLQVYSIYYGDLKRPCLITALSLAEARLFALYSGSNVVHRPVRKVLPFRGNPWRHIAVPRDVLVSCMRRNAIGI
jgi:hypothetical protein